MGKKLGVHTGEICNRNGCIGVIEEKEHRECSCHISPPCAACTEPREYCDKCGWSREEKLHEYEKALIKSNENPDRYRIKKLKDLDKSKIDYICKSHTHFSMIKEGVFPEGTKKEDLLNKIRGTFGGRFEYLRENSFKYIAYTD